jgi:hypothetical protein
VVKALLVDILVMVLFWQVEAQVVLQGQQLLEEELDQMVQQALQIIGAFPQELKVLMDQVQKGE